MKRAAFSDLPLFATDAELGAALMGPSRVREWTSIAPLLEAKGLPRVDPLMGGRFVVAVEAFFRRQYGLEGAAPMAPDGGEDLSLWQSKRKRRA